MQTTNLSCLEFMKAMRLEFGNFEFKAISPQGHLIQSKGWIEQTFSLEINPQVKFKSAIKVKAK